MERRRGSNRIFSNRNRMSVFIAAKGLEFLISLPVNVMHEPVLGKWQLCLWDWTFASRVLDLECVWVPSVAFTRFKHMLWNVYDIDDPVNSTKQASDDHVVFLPRIYRLCSIVVSIFFASRKLALLTAYKYSIYKCSARRSQVWQRQIHCGNWTPKKSPNH